jgi:hypothetical protein
MSALPTRIEREAGRPLTPLEIFDITAAREATLSRLLMLYIGTGLTFMLLPGTFLGVWNLLSISSHRAAGSVSATWIQAHGHAQIFGWIGTFILRYWLLFNSEVAPHESIWVVSRGGSLGVVDLGRDTALAKQCLPMAVAFFTPAVGTP